MLGATSHNYPPVHQFMNPHPLYSWIIVRGLKRWSLSIDVLVIMSQSYFETFEEETEEDIILDVVDITSQTYWENHSEWEIQLYIGLYYYYIWLYIRYIYIYIYIYICIMGRVRNVEDRRIDTKRQQSHHDTTIFKSTSTKHRKYVDR